MTINVLGTEYEIKKSHAGDDVNLSEMDGYCDHTTKTIVINTFKDTPESLDDLDEYERKVTRHELVHAFLTESGLGCCSWADKEEIVDWIAYQFPKMLKAFQEAKCI